MYDNVELISILDSLVKIISESEELKPFANGFYQLFQEANGLGDKTLTLHVKDPEDAMEVRSSLAEIERSIMDNAKAIRALCYENHDDEGFHLGEKDTKEVYKLGCSMQHSIKSYESILEYAKKLGR